MDSFGLHLERMSNLDLHPLSLPISRLSPAKSNSSITDQLTHHQHGKGDSAYSSFSGGSTVPDYPSPFLQDDLQPSSFNHYSDLKYVKAVYHPCQVHQSETRSMDQLYHSVEAISQQHRNSNIGNQRQNGHDRCHADGKVTASPNPPRSHHPPPPPPERLDSFVATRNLENTRGHHQGAKPQPQQLRTHMQQMPSDFHLPTMPQDTLKSNQMAVPEHGDPNLLYQGWRETQQEPVQSHQLPSYRPPPKHHDAVHFSNSEHIFPVNQSKCGKPQMPASLLNKPPPQGTNQTENQKNRQRARSSGGSDGTNKGGNHFDRHRKRAHSAKESPQSFGPEPNRSSSPGSAGQNTTTSGTQHKGQFYFVTGKQTGTGGRKLSVSSCASEAGSESSTVVETFSLREKERCHSTMDNFFRPPQYRPYQSTDKMQVYSPMSQEQDSVFNNEDDNLSSVSNGPSPRTIQPAHSFDSLEQKHLIQCQEIGRHIANHPIFFCGPEESYTPQGSQRPTKEATTMRCNDQLNFCKREDLAKKGRRQPLGDVASERINKETTPLLYHLTGANRVAQKTKKDIMNNGKGQETTFNKAGHKDVNTRSKERSLQIETVAEVGREVVSNACNTLDDSFKKYYKEQLKDAQSKVLRETSFKRRDLQLSWPHRIKEQRPELRPTVIHNFSASQDSETSTETLTPSVASEEMETGSIKKEVLEEEKDEEGQRENGRPLNVAQPQVARIGCRKRLTHQQKKMCFSEPEKLHQLGDSPNHSVCRSLGNELEHFISTECLTTQEPEQHGEHGLVAARRKIFETRGRAFSASSLSKTNLKNLQHKALVEYVERKTGHKVAEPQQPGPQLPPPPRQRHSIGEKPVGWPAKSPASTGGQGFKKKLRPHSAGRILDSSSSSIRYSQFFSAQPSPSGVIQGSDQPSLKESQSAQGKSASVGSLLSQTEPTGFFRNRSRSTPHAFQAHGPEDDSSPANAMETESSEQGSVAEEAVVRPAATGSQQRVRVVAQRGKSMEELGTLRCSRPPALSKSSEQLDQLWNPPVRPGREKRSLPSLLDDGRRDEMAYLQGLEQARRGMETLGLEKTQPLGGQKQTHRRTPSKAGSTSQLGADEETRPAAHAEAMDLSRSASPASSNLSRVRIPSGTPSSHGPVWDEARLATPGSESSDPQSPNGPETRERDIKSTSASPSLLSQARSPIESKPGSRDRRSTSGPASSPERPSDDDPRGASPPPDPDREVTAAPRPPTPPPPPPPGVVDESRGLPLREDASESKSKSAHRGSHPRGAVPLHPSPSDGVPEAEPLHPAERAEERGVAARSAPGPEKDPDTGEEPGARRGEGEGEEEPPAKPRWAELAAEVVKADGTLAKALYPLANRKTALMLMEQLLSEDTLLMEEHYKKKQEQRAGPAAESAADVQPSSASDEDDNAVPCSDPQIQADITEKKRVLVSYAEECLRGLEQARGLLQTEVQENAVRGEAVLALVRERCLPLEVERYSLFIGDLERVVSLLLCLSARLARVQNALSTVDQHTDAEEKESLDSRHRLLCKQREDAKDLKDNLDRRESVVSAFLARQLSGAQLGDYRRFVQTAASLLIRQKDLEERRQLAEEQAEALRCSLPPAP